MKYDVGHSISDSPFAYHRHDSSAASRPLGLDYRSLCDVSFIGLEFILNQHYPSDPLSRNRIWNRWLFGIHTVNLVHVRVVR